MGNRTYYKWRPQDIQFLKDNFEQYSCKELAAMIGCSEYGVKRKRYDLKIVKSKEALSRLYKRPNAGQFTKGSNPLNTLHDKAVTSRIDNKGNIYKWIRLSKAKWQMLHVYLWLTSGREIPAGHIVVFKDGNRDNCVLSNLQLMTRGQSLRINRKSYLVKKGEKIVKKKETVIRHKAIKKEVIKKVRVWKQKKQRIIEKKKQISKPIIPVPKKTVEKKFKFLMVDYNSLQRVKIDAKTSIYIKAGEDPEAARVKYLTTYKKALCLK